MDPASASHIKEGPCIVCTHGILAHHEDSGCLLCACKEWREGAQQALPDQVNHPAHYGGDTVYEVVKVCEAWQLDGDAYLFMTVKYVARAGKKVVYGLEPEDVSRRNALLEDLQKARWYLDRKIKNMGGTCECSCKR